MYFLVMGKHLDDDEINMNLNNCKLSGRWIILQGKTMNMLLMYILCNNRNGNIFFRSPQSDRQFVSDQVPRN